MIMAWLAGCTDQTPDDQAQRNGDTLTQRDGDTHVGNGTTAEWQREKHDFENDIHAKHVELSRKLGKLEGKAENAAGATKDKLQQQISQLEKQLNEAETKLDNLDNATPATWEMMKSEVKTAFDSAEQAFDRAAEPMENSRQ
jgi:hypothetical protein